MSSIDQVAATSGLYKSPKYSVSELNPDLLPSPEDLSYVETMSPPKISLVRNDLPPCRPAVQKQLSAAEDVTPDIAPDPASPPSEQIPRSRSPLSFVTDHFSKMLSRPEGAGLWSGGSSGRWSGGRSGSGTVFYTGTNLASPSSDIWTVPLHSTQTGRTVDSRETDGTSSNLGRVQDRELDSDRGHGSDTRMLSCDQLVSRSAGLK